MTSAESLRWNLEDLIGEMVHARRSGDLGRLALLSYCDLRRWARVAGRDTLADHAYAMFVGAPQSDRATFLARVDELIAEAETTLTDWPA